MSDGYGSVRLPTRCPACKGSVIERMPSASHGTFLWFHCLFCQHVWKFRVDENPNGELTGDVFVVTKGGKKHKLGAVAVTAIPEDALKRHLKNKTLQAEVDSQKLMREIDHLTTALKTTLAEDDRLWKILQRDENNARKAAAWSAAYNKGKHLAKQIEDVRARRQYLTSGDYFFEGLPAGIAAGKTGADGKFTLIIPRRDRFGIVARAELQLFKKTEIYSWFVWVSLDGLTSKRLVLTNANMIGAGSKDSALR
jgi:hypothetical protein